jgi:hypothetical protein
MKKLIIILFLLPLLAQAQVSITTAPLLNPSNPDSIKVPTVVNGSLRNVYTVDLSKKNVTKVKHTADSATIMASVNGSDSTIIATANQSVFSFSTFSGASSYSKDVVYLNGYPLTPLTDYTAAGNTITLISGADDGDKLRYHK